jgi:signal transduction histidine kinase
MARAEEGKLLYAVVGAFAAVAVAFILASVGATLASREIGEASGELLSNAFPSVTALMNARTELRRLEVDVDVLTRMPQALSILADDLKRARAEFDATLRAELATPWFEGEREVYENQVLPRVEQLHRALDDLDTAAAGAGAPPLLAAVGGFDAAAIEVDAGLDAWAQVNHAGGFKAALRIVNAHADSAKVTLFLDLGASVVAMAATVLAVRAARRFARLARRNVELETDRADEVGVFAQRVAHDLLSPLSAVNLSLGAIQRAHRDADTTRALERARHALERSREMVHGIYSFSGSGARPNPRARAPLRQAISEAVDGLLAAEATSPPAIDVKPFDEVDVAADPAVLDVILSNLLSNAAKFMRDSPIRRITVRVDVESARVRVEIEDTGPGVPPGLEQSIFEPYHRAPGVNQPGLGLGLPIVRRLVLAHGGALGVRRDEPSGATFWFELPRAREPAEETPAAEQPAPVCLWGPRPQKGMRPVST